MASISEWAGAHAVFHVGQLKNRSFQILFFFDIVTTQYDHPRYVKHVLGCIYEFFTLFGYWVPGGGGGGGGSLGWIHSLLMQFFTPDNSKIEVSEPYFFFDISTTQYDHPRYVKHVLGRIYVFFTLFGYWVRGGGGGAPKGWVHHLLM